MECLDELLMSAPIATRVSDQRVLRLVRAFLKAAPVTLCQRLSSIVLSDELGLRRIAAHRQGQGGTAQAAHGLAIAPLASNESFIIASRTGN
jgi:hypothetical protein